EDLVLVAQIELDRERPPAAPLAFLRDRMDGAGQLAVRLGCLSGDYHIGTRLSAAQCDGLADTARGTGDEHRAPAQIRRRAALGSGGGLGVCRLGLDHHSPLNSGLFFAVKATTPAAKSRVAVEPTKAALSASSCVTRSVS